MGAFIDMTGQIYERLTVLERGDNDKQGHATWRCRCECGELRTVRGSNLRNDHTQSCGCQLIVHGMRKSRTWVSWNMMKDRVLNPNSPSYSHYGGRGITIDPMWLDFKGFFESMGVRPEDTSIDRIDPFGNYEPGNCRWSSAKVQANNKRTNVWLEWLGMRRTMAQWAEIADMNPGTFKGRIARGWSCHQALTTPVGSPRIVINWS